MNWSRTKRSALSRRARFATAIARREMEQRDAFERRPPIGLTSPAPRVVDAETRRLIDQWMADNSGSMNEKSR